MMKNVPIWPLTGLPIRAVKARLSSPFGLSFSLREV